MTVTKEHLVDIFDEIKDEDDAEAFFVELARTNDGMYNKTKLLEELAELNEKILKSINKHPDHKPPQSEIIEEIGDVLIRIKMYNIMEGITDQQIRDRVILKANKFIGYIKDGIYSNL